MSRPFYGDRLYAAALGLFVAPFLLKSEGTRWIGFGHQVDVRLRDSLFTQRLEELRQAVRVQRTSRLAEVARENAGLRPDGANRFRVIAHAYPGGRAVIRRN